MDITQVTLQDIVAFAGIILTIASVVKLVVTPFQNSIDKIKLALDALDKTISNLDFEIKSSKEDRNQLHQQVNEHNLILKNHGERILINEREIKHLKGE